MRSGSGALRAEALAHYLLLLLPTTTTMTTTTAITNPQSVDFKRNYNSDIRHGSNDIKTG